MLQVSGLCKRFGAQWVANELNLQVKAGEILVLLGPSGSGKSSLLAMLAGLLRPDAGSMTLNGIDLLPLPPEARHCALMFQDFALFPHLDVLANVAFGLVERGVPRHRANQRAQAALDDVGLANLSRRGVDTLSGGEQQRVALARALVTAPQLMLLDEPFSSLDAHLRRQLRTDFRKRLLEAQIPSIVVTHDHEDAMALADQIAVLHEGCIVQCAPPATLLASPCSSWLARFMGLDNVSDDAKKV